MSKVLVTGSAGFIGKHLISHLKTNKYKVIELSHSDGDISSPDLFLTKQYSLIPFESNDILYPP